MISLEAVHGDMAVLLRVTPLHRAVLEKIMSNDQVVPSTQDKTTNEFESCLHKAIHTQSLISIEPMDHQ